MPPLGDSKELITWIVDTMREGVLLSADAQRKAERRAVVALLRAQSAGWASLPGDKARALAMELGEMADIIERGDHLGEGEME